MSLAALATLRTLVEACPDAAATAVVCRLVSSAASVRDRALDCKVEAADETEEMHGPGNVGFHGDELEDHADMEEPHQYSEDDGSQFPFIPPPAQNEAKVTKNDAAESNMIRSR